MVTICIISVQLDFREYDFKHNIDRPSLKSEYISVVTPSKYLYVLGQARVWHGVFVLWCVLSWGFGI